MVRPRFSGPGTVVSQPIASRPPSLACVRARFADTSSHAVHQAEAQALRACAFVGRRRAVPSEHLRTAPPAEPHQVAFAAALGEEVVREVVPQLVWVQALDPGLLAPL